MKLMDSKPIRFIRVSYKYLLTRYQKAIIVANYDITSRCNLRCRHCYFFKTQDLPLEEPSDEQWANIFKNHFQEGVRIAYITGGEPSLRPDVLRCADRTFSTVVIISNGTTRVPEDIQRRIFISLDGDREVHEKIRGADCFDDIMANVKNDKRVIFTPTISTINYHLIDELVEITRHSGTAGICFNLYTSHRDNGDPLLLEGEQLEETLNKMENVRKKYPRQVLLSPRMIQMFRTKEHVKHCGFRKGRYLSFFSDLTPKHPCVMGEEVNCDTCGCIVPIFITAVKKADVRSYLIMDRMFPSRYQKQGGGTEH